MSRPTVVLTSLGVAVLTSSTLLGPATLQPAASAATLPARLTAVLSVPAVVRLGTAVPVDVTITGPARAPVSVTALGTGFTGCGTPGTSGRAGRLSRTGKGLLRCYLSPAPATLSLAVRVSSGAATVRTRAVVRQVGDRLPLPGAAARSRWQQLSDALLARATAAHLDPIGHSASVAGLQTLLDVRTGGWADAAVVRDVQELAALRKPDGGWGLDTGWDAFGDGSVNPVDTSYSVTTAGVGLVLLEAHQHGAADRDVVERALQVLIDMPRPPLPAGQCVGYSSAPSDATWCVWNVSFGVAVFLQRALAAGIELAGQRALLDDLRATLTQQLDPRTGYWPYRTGTTGAQDSDHNGYTLLSATALLSTAMLPTVPGSATVSAAASRFVGTPWWQHPHREALWSYGYGFARLLPLHCDRAASPTVLDTYAALSVKTTRFDLLHAAWDGLSVLDACFADAGTGATVAAVPGSATAAVPVPSVPAADGVAVGLLAGS